MKATTYIIILVLLVIIFLQKECNTVNQPLVRTSYIYDTIIDTVVLESNVYVPLPIYHDTGSTILLYQIVDTISNSNGFGNIDYLLLQTYSEINKLTYSNLKEIMILKQKEF